MLRWRINYAGENTLPLLPSKAWNLKPSVPADYVETLQQEGIHKVIAQVLYNRGYHTPEDALSFLGHYDRDDNPFHLKGMTEAVFRLRMAIRHKEPIAVYGDFDCDGVTSTVLLTEVLEKLGAIVRPYIPDRVDEGYGLNSPALENLANEGVRVVITVDCGIRSVKEVQDGISYGLDMIITDHHSVGQEVPPALAVINPKQSDCPYPEKMLAGVGLAYKVAQGLYMEASRRGYRSNGWHPDDWLDLVAIGTVADIAPLRGENRMLVKRGLERLNTPQRTGLLALYEVAGIKPGSVDSMTIGFKIGPRINAAGRLEKAMIAADLLRETSSTRARDLAKTLNEINRERQSKTADMQTLAMESIPDEKPFLLFARDARFEQGIVGLVASRLTEEHYRPSVVVQVGAEESHASCRSIPEFHITKALEQCSDLLIKFGGHAAAAGFTVANENIDLLQGRLQEIAHSQLGNLELRPTIDVDAELSLDEASFELINAMEELEPMGEANEAPTFITRKVRVKDVRAVGAEEQHLKLVLSNEDGPPVEAIAFRMGEHVDSLNGLVEIVYALEINEWNGRKSVQLRIIDLQPSETGEANEARHERS